MPVWYRLPDAGMPAKITTPRITIPQVRNRTYGRLPDAGRPATIVPRPKPAAKPKPKITLSQPKISYSANAPSGGSGVIQLPTANSNTLAAISGLRSNATLQQMAREAVMLEAQPQLNALGSAYNQENKDYGFIINSMRKQLGLSKGDIGVLYDTLDFQLAKNAQDQAKINTQTKTDIGKIYDTLNTQIGQDYSQAQGRTSAELSRLGIVNPNANDRLTENQALLQAQAQQSKANSSSLIDAINASTQGMMGGLRAGAASTRAMLISGLQSQFDKDSADALQKHIAKLSEIKMQKSTLSASLPAKINQTYQALLDQQYQREMDAAQKLFDNQIKLGNYNLNVQNSQANQQYRQNQLALDAQKLATQQSMAAQQKVANLKGSDKSLAFLQQLAKTSHVPYSTLQNILIEAINGDPTPNAAGAARLPGFDKTQFNAYASDINNFLKQRGMSSLYTDMIRALNYWFGG